jgi:hypothetical protein
MKWLDKWLATRMKHGSELMKRAYMEESSKEAQYEYATASPSVGTANSIKGSSPRSHGMNFTVYPANGGHVLEYQYYDPKNDRHTTSLHIITVDQNMGDVIGQAITLEMLKR